MLFFYYEYIALYTLINAMLYIVHFRPPSGAVAEPGRTSRNLQGTCMSRNLKIKIPKRVHENIIISEDLSETSTCLFGYLVMLHHRPTCLMGDRHGSLETEMP